jgi:hypothetical protein
LLKWLNSVSPNIIASSVCLKLLFKLIVMVNGYYINKIKLSNSNTGAKNFIWNGKKVNLNNQFII